MPKVYVVNKSTVRGGTGHDFSPAEAYGEIVYLSEGPMNRYATNHMHRKFTEIIDESNPEDYIVPCSLNVMNSIACAVFAVKHGRLNLLLFKQGEYLERNLII